MCSMDTVSYEILYRNKKVKVTLEYPKQPNKKAEQEFYDRLKELVLSRMDGETPQNAAGGVLDGMFCGASDSMQKGET